VRRVDGAGGTGVRWGASAGATRRTRAVAITGTFALACLALACGTDGRGALQRGVASPVDVAAADSGTTDTSVPTTPTTAAPLRTFVLAATGDFLLHTRVIENAAANAGGDGYDFAPHLAEIAPLIGAADLALCHLETPLSIDNTRISDYPIFSVPWEIARDARAAGYDGCSTASNHSLDTGATGVVETVTVFEQVGLGQSGMARSAAEAAAPPIYDAAGVAVGHLSYTYGLNGMPLPEPWMANLIDVDRILADAAAVRARGAEVVVVSMHWGNEYQHEPSPQQVAQAEALLASPDIDVILGAHAHVVQPVDRIGGKPVVYGMGNSLSNQTDPANRRDGVVVYLTFTETSPGSFEVGRIAVTPTWVHYPGTIIRPVTADSVPESFNRTMSNLNLLGTFDGDVVYDPESVRPS
jgi:hypothetical protein